MIFFLSFFFDQICRVGPDPTLPDPNPNHPKTGSDSGSRIPFLSRPDPPRDLCRVGFGHGFSARTRPTYTLKSSQLCEDRQPGNKMNAPLVKALTSGG
ncbi:hypothetical protein PGT21_016848 [Puccinia graminis f. sp. tritici]|uniref:Uncharacterized protein n=1 Tax=Puccinia graminis f. sp. tritici TaxID=56615 RepID=A0A5B0MRI7_PUCGR|nr:hypothetical protein PGT21_016848 [Puccinia graminis f. sp. tritici]